MAKSPIESHLAAVRAGCVKIPAAEMPEGSIILKMNYSNVNRAGIIHQTAKPAVLIVLYKRGN